MTDSEKQRALEGALLGLLGMGGLMLLGTFPKKQALKYIGLATAAGASAGYLYAKGSEDIAGLFGGPKANQLAAKGVW